jgi:hypothetical protein
MTETKVRRRFNPHSEEDVKLAQEFFADLAWGEDGCPFLLEKGYDNIPEMMLQKIQGMK